MVGTSGDECVGIEEACVGDETACVGLETAGPADRSVGPANANPGEVLPVLVGEELLLEVRGDLPPSSTAGRREPELLGEPPRPLPNPSAWRGASED